MCTAPHMTLRTHNDGTIFAEHVEGRPPLVLALHGWGRDRSDLLAALGGHAAISLDLPGFGASPPPPDVWGAREYADAVARLLRESETEPVVVVGHSFGGRVAASLAAEHGELVRGVVFVGAPLLRTAVPGRPPTAYRVLRAMRKRGLVPESALERARSRYGSADYTAASGRMREVLVKVVNEEYSSELSRLKCPVALLWGDSDTDAPPGIAQRAAELVRDPVIVEVLQGIGHDVHRSAPEALAAAIDAVAAET